MASQDQYIEALLTQVEFGAGRELQEDERDRLRRMISDRLKQVGTLQQFPLTNADEPFSVFRAYREEG